MLHCTQRRVLLLCAAATHRVCISCWNAMPSPECTTATAGDRHTHQSTPNDANNPLLLSALCYMHYCTPIHTNSPSSAQPGPRAATKQNWWHRHVTVVVAVNTHTPSNDALTPAPMNAAMCLVQAAAGVGANQRGSADTAAVPNAAASYRQAARVRRAHTGLRSLLEIHTHTRTHTRTQTHTHTAGICRSVKHTHAAATCKLTVPHTSHAYMRPCRTDSTRLTAGRCRCRRCCRCRCRIPQC